MNCPFCKKILDHTGTKYHVSIDDSLFEICPICYVRIRKGEHFTNKVADRFYADQQAQNIKR